MFGSTNFCTRLAKAGFATDFINLTNVCGLSANDWFAVNGAIAFATPADAESSFWVHKLDISAALATPGVKAPWL